MTDLSPEEIERLRRSVAMLPSQSQVSLKREVVLRVLAQLLRLIRELRRLGEGRGQPLSHGARACPPKWPHDGDNLPKREGEGQCLTCPGLPSPSVMRLAPPVTALAAGNFVFQADQLRVIICEAGTGRWKPRPCAVLGLLLLPPPPGEHLFAMVRFVEHDTIIALMQPGLDLPDLTTLLQRPAWQARGACRGQGVEAFFGSNTSDPAPAKAVCADCPVRGECVNFALDEPELVGVWGGTTERERRTMRRASA